MSLKSFYADPYFNIKGFFVQTLLAVIACAVLWHVRQSHPMNFEFSWWQPPVLMLLGIYVGGLSAVWIHNATHHSFPNKFLNSVCGNMAGMHQLWSFSGWRLIHLVHHHYSDDVEHDPHPPRGRTFGRFVLDMFVQSSFTISRRYREHWKEHRARTLILQRVTMIMLLTMASLLLIMWYLLLGPVGFLFFYLPSLAFNHWFFASINYYCHPADENGVTAATNLTKGLYYKIANQIWHGIYYHGNHHRKPMLFNPSKMVARTRNSQPEIEAEAA